jgi:hypothetical protein
VVVEEQHQVSSEQTLLRPEPVSDNSKVGSNALAISLSLVCLILVIFIGRAVYMRMQLVNVKEKTQERKKDINIDEVEGYDEVQQTNANVTTANVP